DHGGDGVRRVGRDRAALPARLPRSGDCSGGVGRAAERGVGSGGEPAARAEGTAELAAAEEVGRAPMSVITKTARQQRIIELLGTRPVRSQSELADLLAADGVQVNLSTL